MSNDKEWGEGRKDDLKMPGWARPEENVPAKHGAQNDDGYQAVAGGRGEVWQDEAGDKFGVAEAAVVATDAKNDNIAVADEKSAVVEDADGDMAVADNVEAISEDGNGNKVWAAEDQVATEATDGTVSANDESDVVMETANGETVGMVDDVEVYGKVDAGDGKGSIGENGAEIVETTTYDVVNGGGDQAEATNAWAAAAQQMQNDVSAPEEKAKNAALEGEPRKKKRVGLIVTICILVLVVLGGIGAALWFFMCHQSDDKVVMDAVTGAISSQRMGMSGEIKMDFGENGPYDGFVTSAKMNLSGVKTPDASSSEGTLTLQLNTGDSLDVMLALVMTNDGVFYVKIDGMTEALTSVEALSGYSDFVTAFSAIENQWYRFTADEMGLTGEARELFDCIVTAMNYLNSEETGKEMARIYEENPFLGAERTSGNDSDGYAVYSVKIDETKLNSYVEGVKQTDAMQHYLGCFENLSGSNDSDGVVDDIEDKGDLAIGDISKLNLHIDYWTHELKAVSFKYVNDEDVSVDGTVYFDASDAVDVTVPTDVKTVEDLKTQIEGVVKSMIKNYALLEAQALCESSTLDMTVESCVALYETQIEEYINELNLDDLWSSLSDAFASGETEVTITL